MMENKKVTDSIYLIDARVFGIPDFTSAYLIVGEELALVETGPAKSAPLIMEGIRKVGVDPRDISYLIVTHVHLDHGGGAGTLVKEMPRAKVVVHEKGARHMVDPSKLVKSSKRVFGPLIDEWYGEVLPIEEDRLMPVKDGDIINLGKGQRLRMIDSPGHANHHICIYSENEGVLFTGDAVGIYLSDSQAQALVPTTPPPEFDPDINIETIKCFFDLDLRLLCFSHFGRTEKVKQNLSKGIEWLMKWKDTVSEMLEINASLQEITGKFRQDTKALIGPNKKTDALHRWVIEHHLPMCASGYLNYFQRKKGERMQEGMFQKTSNSPS